MVNSQHFKTYTGLICFYNKMGSHKAESMSDARVLSLSCEMRKAERDLWIETSVLVSLESCPSLLDAFRVPQLTKHQLQQSISVYFRVQLRSITATAGRPFSFMSFVTVLCQGIASVWLYALCLHSLPSEMIQ